MKNTRSVMCEMKHFRLRMIDDIDLSFVGMTACLRPGAVDCLVFGHSVTATSVECSDLVAKLQTSDATNSTVVACDHRADLSRVKNQYGHWVCWMSTSRRTV